MILEHKHKEVLLLLMKSHSYISIKDLEACLKVSRRTIYYYFEQINQWLVEQDQREVVRIRGKGFSLDSVSKEYLKTLFVEKEERYLYSKEERVALLFLAISLTETFRKTIEEVAEFFQVSKNTIFNDLNELKEQLSHEQVTVSFHKNEGYRILGNELRIRNIIFRFIGGGVELKNVSDLEMLKAGSIGQIEGAINRLEDKLRIDFVDCTVSQLANQIAVVMLRNRKKTFVVLDEIERKTLEETYEHQGVIDLVRWLEKQYQISFSADETTYLTMLVLSTKVKKNFDAGLIHEELNKLDEAVNKMIAEFEFLACINFIDKEILRENLFLHLKPAYYRLKYGIAIQNPLTMRIKKQYREIYQITERVSRHFYQMIGEILPDEELAYIAVHFGAWVQRAKNQTGREKRIVLVCPEGIGVSRILENQLMGLFAGMNIQIDVLSMREYNRLNQIHGDLILSTVFLTDKKVPIYLVNSILSDDEKQKLIKYIFRFFAIEGKAPRMKSIVDIISKYAVINNEEELVCELTEHFMQPGIITKEVQPMLKELITIDRVQIIEEVVDWEASIRTAAIPLVNDGCIEERYVDAMIQSIKDLGPYIVIGPNIGIPHARPEEGVIRTGMSFLKLKKPVSFSESEKHNVELMFVLASKDNYEHMRALRQLTRMLSKQENVQKLRGEITKEEIIEMIEKYSEVE